MADDVTEMGLILDKLSPTDTDVLVLHPRPGGEVKPEKLNALATALAAKGLSTLVVAVPDGADLALLDPDAMAAYGWLRKEDVEIMMAALRGDR